MRSFKRLRSKLFGGPRFEQDMSDELAFHIETRAQDLIRSGIRADEARRRARMEFGGVERWKEECRETRPFRPVDELRADVRYGLRTLARSPVFAVVAILSLATGIGVNTAIFSLIDGLWLRPMAVADGGNITRLFTTSPQSDEQPFSWPEYLEFDRQSRSFSAVVAIGGRGARMERPDGTLELLFINVVSSNFFTTLGVKASEGRVFAPGDGQSLTDHPVVVLGHNFWQRRFGGDRSIVGRQIRIERGGGWTLLTVCGVLPAEFRATEADGDRDIWMPPQTFVALGAKADFEQRDFRWFNVLARIRSGVSVRTATAEASTIAAGLASAWPATNRGRSARAISDLSYRMHAAGTTALVLLGVVLLVVMMSAVNVANLLVARAAARAQEFSIRVAVGAGRMRIIRQMLTESALLGSGGLAAGILLGYVIIRLLPSIIGEPPGYHSLTRFDLDSRVFLFGVSLTIATTFLFGLAPSVRASGTNLRESMNQRSGAAPAGPFPSRQWLISAQVAMAMTLLALAAVLTASFVKTRTTDLGMARRELLLVWCGQLPDDSGGMVREAITRLRSLPGVEDVALAVRAPLTPEEQGMAKRVSFPDRPEKPTSEPLEISYNAVSSNFLRVMGTQIMRGRDFVDADQATGEPVVLISEKMASRSWPGQDPVGKTIRIGAPPGQDHRIIGIVRDVPFNSISDPPLPYLYLPWWRSGMGEVTFILHTQQHAATLAETARRTLIRVDRRLDPFTVTTEAELIRFSALQYELTAELLSILGFIALVLTAMGLYGVIAWSVTRRTREIGIRVALGAEPSTVLGLILRQTAIVGAAGMTLGLPLALTGTKFASSMLFGTAPWDVPMFATAAGLLAAVLLVAGSIPARRATRIDPVQALRIE